MEREAIGLPVGDAKRIAELDARIAAVLALLEPMPGSDPGRADLHAELAILHIGRAQEAAAGEPQRADLDDAIEHGRAALRLLCLHSDDETGGGDGADSRVAGSRAVLVFLLSDRFQVARALTAPGDAAGIAAARSGREEALAQLGEVPGTGGPGEPGWPDLAAAIGLLRYARYDDSWPGSQAPEPADLNAAIDLLTKAAGNEPEQYTLKILVIALDHRFEQGSDPADCEAMIFWAQRLLDHADTDTDYQMTIREFIAGALVNRAARTEAGSPARRADLTAAIAHREAVLAAMPSGDPDQAVVVARLAQACWLRPAGGASTDGEVDQLVGYAARAWRELPADAEVRPEIGVYLAVGMHEQMVRPGGPFDVPTGSTVIDILTQIEPALAGNRELHLIACVELGHFLVSRAQETGSAADLTAARPWLARVTAELNVEDPRLAELTISVAGDMFVLAGLGMAFDDLDSAIGLLTTALRNPLIDPERSATVRGALGMVYSQRAVFTRSGSDFEVGIALLRTAFEMIAPGDPVRLAIAWNLGSAFIDRFQWTGDLQDRDAARYYANILGDPGSPAAPVIAANAGETELIRTSMHGLIRLAEGMGGDLAALNDAVRHLRATVAMLPAGHPSEGRIRGDLGLALMARAELRDGIEAAESRAALREAAAEIAVALDVTPPGHMMRVLLLLRASMAQVGAAMSTGDPVGLRAAIDYMTSTLGEIQPEFGGRFRLIAMIGTAWAHLHRMTGDSAALSAAAGWLSAACDEMADQADHPQYASCLIQLANVQRTRGLASQAREAALAALRARGREVLLQTGTGRGLGVARTAAAVAVDVAAWCLGHGLPEAAVDALELGRGLVLHAATSVAGVPELLTAAGRTELADEWRAQLGSDHQAPWDTGLHGADQAAGLLGGIAHLELPNDLRARALAALAGPAMDRLLAPPGVGRIRLALAQTGADALVYLLDQPSGYPVLALLVPAADLAVAAVLQVTALPMPLPGSGATAIDRKSTRLNSSH